VTPSLLLVYFLGAVAAQTRAQSRQYTREARLADGGTGGAHFHLASGAYVGLAAAVLALLGAGAARRGSLSIRPPLRRLCAAALGIGLLAVLLLPWRQLGLTASARVGELGVALAAGGVAAVLAVRLLVVSWSTAVPRSLELPGLAVGALVFAGAGFTVEFGAVRAAAAWAGLAIAALLALVALADRSLGRAFRPLPLSAGAVAVVGAALVTSLFLPWQSACFDDTTDLQRLGVAGRCLSANGFSPVGSVAAVLTLVLVAVVATAARRPRSTIQLAVGIGLLVTTLGFAVETGNHGGERFSFGYGSFIGFAAAGLLLALAFHGVTWTPRELRATTWNPLPIVLGAAFVFVVVVPWWGVLPTAVGSVLSPDLSWLTLAGALVALRIVHLWIRHARGVPAHGPELVTLSLALVVLAVLDAAPSLRLSWHGAVLLGISVPLTLLAMIEERGGLKNLHVPEILRVDRI